MNPPLSMLAAEYPAPLVHPPQRTPHGGPAAEVSSQEAPPPGRYAQSTAAHRNTGEHCGPTTRTVTVRFSRWPGRISPRRSCRSRELASVRHAFGHRWRHTWNRSEPLASRHLRRSADRARPQSKNRRRCRPRAAVANQLVAGTWFLRIDINARATPVNERLE